MPDSDKVALIDMDGTLALYDFALFKALEELRSPNDPEVSLHGHHPPWLRNRIKLIRQQPGFWRNLEKDELGFMTLDLLKELEYSLMVLTKGPVTTTSAWTEKREWCHEHLPGVPVTVTENKGLVYGKVLFDDYPPYIQAWLKWRPRGKVIMTHHAWNQDFEHERVFRLGTPEDLPALRAFLTT